MGTRGYAEQVCTNRGHTFGFAKGDVRTAAPVQERPAA
jgi:hypothetical protein